jgi:hypothetical protein
MRIAQTPSPKKERIFGSKKNKPKSSESKYKASSIVLNPKTIASIKSIIEKHNDKFSDKKIPLATAKAVVRRGMGAYSVSHRPTIKGGKPNSRVAWGLARLNAFVYKIQKGTSKSGRYNQDDDLINELGYRVKKYAEGGKMENNIIGGKSDKKTIEDIANMHNVSIDFAKEQLEKGIKVEMEHTSDTEKAYEIALDHLFEFINYYIELEKMEEKLSKQAKSGMSNEYKGKILEKINDTIFYRYYPLNSNPFDVSDSLDNKYGKGIYFLDNPYYYQDKFKDGMLVTIKPKLKNPKLYLRKESITPNIDYSLDIIDALKDNIKNKNEFSDKLISEGYDSIIAIEPRGMYLVFLFNDPENYDVLSDKRNMMAYGGEIKPVDFVSDTITSSIEDLIAQGNYSDLTLLEALYFFKTFRNIDYGKGKFMSNDGVKGIMRNKLVNQGYINDSWLIYYETEFADNFDIDDDNYSPTEKGYKFLNAIANRHRTRKGLKEGIDLFPEFANVKEYDTRKESNKAKLDNLIGSLSKKYNDGGEVLLAPNGKPSNLTPEQYRIVRTPEFISWFGDWINSPETASKVVDENGEPLMVIHKTNLENDFYVFDKNKIGDANSFTTLNGFFFGNYEKESNNLRNILCFLSIKNPIVLNQSNTYFDSVGYQEAVQHFIQNGTTDYLVDYLEHEEYDDYEINEILDNWKYTDGVIVKNLYYDNFDIEYVVFQPEQIKLADGTNTTFDGNNPDIRYSNGGNVYFRNLANIKILNERESRTFYRRTYADGTIQEFSVLGESNSDIRYANGGQASSWEKMTSASSRFKPSETIVFDPPLIGLNGNKLTSYTWSYEMTMQPNWEGELVSKRVSDWTQAEASAETGRNLVHQYTIELPNGDIKTVSSESVPILLGYVDRTQAKAFGNLATASKTLAKQQMQLAIMEAQKKEYDEIVAKYEKELKPQIRIATLDELGWGAKIKMEEAMQKNEVPSQTFFTMGDVIIGQYNKDYYDSNYGTKYILIDTPNKNTIEQLTSMWISKRVEEDGGKYPRGLYDLKNRVERQKRKVENLLSNKN